MLGSLAACQHVRLRSWESPTPAPARPWAVPVPFPPCSDDRGRGFITACRGAPLSGEASCILL